jgi:hypothetical protein
LFSHRFSALLFTCSFVSSLGAGELGRRPEGTMFRLLPGICNIVPALESGVEPPHCKEE